MEHLAGKTQIIIMIVIFTSFLSSMGFLFCATHLSDVRSSGAAVRAMSVLCLQTEQENAMNRSGKEEISGRERERERKRVIVAKFTTTLLLQPFWLGANPLDALGKCYFPVFDGA